MASRRSNTSGSAAGAGVRFAPINAARTKRSTGSRAHAASLTGGGGVTRKGRRLHQSSRFWNTAAQSSDGGGLGAGPASAAVGGLAPSSANTARMRNERFQRATAPNRSRRATAPETPARDSAQLSESKGFFGTRTASLTLLPCPSLNQECPIR